MPDPVRLTASPTAAAAAASSRPRCCARSWPGCPAAGAFADLMVGTETTDDAAVWRLNDTQALVATTDFFMPVVDDPFDFGRIAATNALSDVYAMGGAPIFALAIVGMPVGRMPVETIRGILAGGAAVCAAAGMPVAGGHSIDSVEPIYGLVALGLVAPGPAAHQPRRPGRRRADPDQAARRRRLSAPPSSRSGWTREATRP